MHAWTRRAGLAGLGALAVAPALGEDRPPKKPSPIAHGVLADNSMAQAFEPSPEDSLPDLTVVGTKGRRSIRDFKGRTVLMPLWAEWCAPCMSEMADFARLQRKYGNDRFTIIPVLTATRKQFTPEFLVQVFALMHCDVFEPLIEYNRGDRLQQAMAKEGRRGTALPCNLLIAPDGRVVAREMGAITADSGTPAKTYGETLDKAQANEVQSRWGEADGEAFAKAMAEGFVL